MRCLWLTLADPEPRHNGQYIYSGGLIDAMVASGAEMHVVGLSRSDSPRRPVGSLNSDGVHWWLGGHQLQSSLQSLTSVLPNIAYRSSTTDLRNLLQARLHDDSWDAIVFDGISTGWALSLVLHRFPYRAQRPKIVYVSHNHEASLRREIAVQQDKFLRRKVLQYDAMKVAHLENSLVEEANFVTAITPNDAAKYLLSHPDRRVEVLTPGYAGGRTDRRRITKETPRRAVIIGSFDWIAKRMNLEQFLAVADPLFARHGAELQVIGSAEEAFLQQMRRKAMATEFTGQVDGVLPYMQDARVAVVAERHGGGFKLKVLDYIFNRMPILALDGSVAGVPLQRNDSILLYTDYEALARGVLEVIDNCELLNNLQERAYNSCRDQFNWASRGKALLSALAA